jgi:hypothetical protein
LAGHQHLSHTHHIWCANGAIPYPVIVFSGTLLTPILIEQMRV